MKQASKKTIRAAAAVPKPQPNNPAIKPTPGQIEEALEIVIGTQLEADASALALAREIWRSNRKLVEAPNFPEPWRKTFVRVYAYEPTDRRDKFRSLEQLRKDQLPEAEKLAAKWANEGKPSQTPSLDIGDSLRRSALQEAQNILADLADSPPPMPVFDALLLRDLLLAYDDKGLLSAIEHLCGLPASKAA